MDDEIKMLLLFLKFNSEKNVTKNCSFDRFNEIIYLICSQFDINERSAIANNCTNHNTIGSQNKTIFIRWFRIWRGIWKIIPISFPSSTVNIVYHPFQRPRLGLRKQNLPPYPHIDCVRTLETATFLPSHYKLVKYGDYEFMESSDGFVQVFVQGYQNPRQLDTKAGYSVFFSTNNPL